jgi:hypothetical protein
MMILAETKEEEKTFHSNSYRLKGKCEELKAHVYNVIPGKNGLDFFAKTTTEIGQYIACTVLNGGEFALIVHPDNLSFPVMPAPPLPADQNDVIEVKIWKAANKQHNDLMEKRDENQRQVYAMAWGQCSYYPRSCEGQCQLPDNHNNLDLISLLGLIRTSMYTGVTSKDMLHSLIDVMERFQTFKQTSWMDNANYLQTFQIHVETIDHHDLGVHMLYIQAQIQDAGGDPDDVAVWEQTKYEIHEEFVVKYFCLIQDFMFPWSLQCKTIIF